MRAERLALLERHQSALSLRAQTDLLSLNRTSLYYRPLAPTPEEVALKHRIDEISTDRPYYGVRRITAQLRRDGILVNHKAIARHMREMGLVAIYPGPNLSKRAHRASIYPYLLRDVNATRPNHVWGIDRYCWRTSNQTHAALFGSSLVSKLCCVPPEPIGEVAPANLRKIA